jgi:hypothetical protein
MPSGFDAEKTVSENPTDPRESLDGRKSYRVILEDIASGIETTDSFAIKFSLLTKTPLSKMKHVVHSMPAMVWSGQGRSRADRVLALIEEAGGRGSVVETRGGPPASPAEQPATVKSKLACRWCGFPMKEDETRCGFCMTAVGDTEKSEPHPEPRMPAKARSRKRLILCAAVLVLGIVIIGLLAR